ncbi:helix-turn-helix domain-containing protein [Glycomyces xiaoerkulensis]|uniref:helix-turn-helix domain-containing protein n=1 Tax=Glycomyces xiaoerkulensis TaxID=2038139 RepID=UPI000C2691AD|nr:helix-turn-helix transcriptional regulator [Glycomyces xiaoerkulensis]
MAIITGPGPSLRSQWLGEKLRELRVAKKMSLRVAGEYLQRDASTMSRYESGEYPLRRADLVALMTLYDVSDPKARADLEQICEDAWQRDWWDRHKADFGKDFINLPWLESRANRICKYQQMVVEGLLQTRDYAEMLIRKAEEGHALEEQIERWVDLRMDRQQVLGGEAPVELSVILEEYVLDRAVGGPEVWRRQLKRLLSECLRDNVEIRIMPADRAPHAGHLGSFMLFEMPDPYPRVAHLDTLAGSLFVEDPKVQRVVQVWEDLSAEALDPERSAELITARIEEMK